MEMARVSAVAVVIEADHPGMMTNGSVADNDEYDNPAVARFTATQPPNASWKSSQSLARSVAPSPHILGKTSLLQLAPQALVNRTSAGLGAGRSNKCIGEFAPAEEENGSAGELADSPGASFTGIAVVPSRALVESTLEALGFNGKY